MAHNEESLGCDDFEDEGRLGRMCELCGEYEAPLGWCAACRKTTVYAGGFDPDGEAR